MGELETNLAFAKSGKDGVLSKVRENFVDYANTCLKNMHTHLSKVQHIGLYNICLDESPDYKTILSDSNTVFTVDCSKYVD
jgi:hypothetical protein